MSGPAQQQPAYLAWTDSAGVYQSMRFDVVEDETWSGGADITKHPVEVGPNISDNIRVRLRKCTLKVIATNEPIGRSNWSIAVLANLGLIPVTNQRAINIAQAAGAGAVSITPGDGIISVPEWDSQLQLRILAGTAAGLVGGAIGGTAGGTLGAIAGSALSGALLPGRVVYDPVQTSAPTTTSRLALGPSVSISPNVVTFANPGDFVLQTIAQLEELCAKGQTIDVWGTKSSCIGPGSSSISGGPSGLGGMAIADLSHTRNAAGGTGASITIALEEIRIVYTETVPAPKPTVKDASKKVAKGNQNPSELSAAASKIAAAALDGYTQGKARLNPTDLPVPPP